MLSHGLLLSKVVRVFVPFVTGYLCLIPQVCIPERLRLYKELMDRGKGMNSSQHHIHLPYRSKNISRFDLTSQILTKV